MLRENGYLGAYQNVLINMVDIDGESFKAETLKEAEAREKRAREKCSEVLDILDKI